MPSPAKQGRKEFGEVNSECHLRLVIKIGKAEIIRLVKLWDKENFETRVPLTDAGGNLVGAVRRLLFRDLQETGILEDSIRSHM